MKQSLKISTLLLIGILYTHRCYAQWTAQDSLKLKELLEGQGEIEMNKRAIKSIDFNSTEFLGQPTPDKKLFLFDETLPNTPGLITEEEQPKFGLALKPYSGGTRLNYDPVYKRKIPMEQKKNGGIVYKNDLPGGGMGAMNGTRFMMMNGTLSGSFKYDFDKILSKDFWEFNVRRTTKRTLRALNTYADLELANGRYEYYHVDQESYTVDFTGSGVAEEEINADLKDHYQVQKGLFYFKYTDFAKGEFTYFRPEKPDIKGEFTTNGTVYRLSYDGYEFVITFSRVGGRYYTMKCNLTKKFQSQYSSEEVEKVFLISTALRISFGSDKR